VRGRRGAPGASSAPQFIGIMLPTQQLLLAILASALLSSAEGMQNPLRVLRRDWAALNTRVTARHIMRPLTSAGRSECQALKAEVASATTTGVFVVDAFARVAIDHSLDEETRSAGGLLGKRFTQGWVRSTH